MPSTVPSRLPIGTPPHIVSSTVVVTLPSSGAGHTVRRIVAITTLVGTMRKLATNPLTTHHTSPQPGVVKPCTGNAGPTRAAPSAIALTLPEPGDDPPRDRRGQQRPRQPGHGEQPDHPGGQPDVAHQEDDAHARALGLA